MRLYHKSPEPSSTFLPREDFYSLAAARITIFGHQGRIALTSNGNIYAKVVLASHHVVKYVFCYNSTF